VWERDHSITPSLHHPITSVVIVIIVMEEAVEETFPPG
jgi:hypothetical protein